MIQEALNGEIDQIFTKFISRFVRNTVDMLQTVRELKAASVEVVLEKENCPQMRGDTPHHELAGTGR